MRLVLVRHAQTPSNVKALLDTEVPGPGLTDVGLEQADRLVDRLTGYGATRVYVSDMVRTQLTAAPYLTATALPQHIRPGLREIHAGDLCMAGDLASAGAYREVITAWAGGDLTPRLPGGEAGADVFARFDAVVAEAAGDAEPCAVLVSHGAMIRCWVSGRAANLPHGFAAENFLDNTDIVVLDRVEGDWLLREWAGREFSSAS